jgi:hypothetical protein
LLLNEGLGVRNVRVEPNGLIPSPNIAAVPALGHAVTKSMLAKESVLLSRDDCNDRVLLDVFGDGLWGGTRTYGEEQPYHLTGGYDMLMSQVQTSGLGQTALLMDNTKCLSRPMGVPEILS